MRSLLLSNLKKNVPFPFVTKSPSQVVDALAKNKDNTESHQCKNEPICAAGRNNLVIQEDTVNDDYHAQNQCFEQIANF